MRVGARRRESKAATHSTKDETGGSGDRLDARLAALCLKFTPEDLIDALERLQRSESGADLPAHHREFWDTYSGISLTSRALALGSANNAAAQIRMDSFALTSAEVARNLQLSASTVRHYKAERKLYSYLANGRLVFPDWQFTSAGDRAIPGLGRVLSALPPDLHPQAVAGFFLTPQPDLVINGVAVSAAVWLVEGGSADPVLETAHALTAGY